jgi:hypothetical protein
MDVEVVAAGKRSGSQAAAETKGLAGNRYVRDPDYWHLPYGTPILADHPLLGDDMHRADHALMQTRAEIAAPSGNGLGSKLVHVEDFGGPHDGGHVEVYKDLATGEPEIRVTFDAEDPARPHEPTVQTFAAMSRPDAQNLAHLIDQWDVDTDDWNEKDDDEKEEAAGPASDFGVGELVDYSDAGDPRKGRIGWRVGYDYVGDMVISDGRTGPDGTWQERDRCEMSTDTARSLRDALDVGIDKALDVELGIWEDPDAPEEPDESDELDEPEGIRVGIDPQRPGTITVGDHFNGGEADLTTDEARGIVQAANAMERGEIEPLEGDGDTLQQTVGRWTLYRHDDESATIQEDDNPHNMINWDTFDDLMDTVHQIEACLNHTKATPGLELKAELVRIVRKPMFWPDGRGGWLPVGAPIVQHEDDTAHAVRRVLEENYADADGGHAILHYDTNETADALRNGHDRINGDLDAGSFLLHPNGQSVPVRVPIGKLRVTPEKDENWYPVLAVRHGEQVVMADHIHELPPPPRQRTRAELSALVRAHPEELTNAYLGDIPQNGAMAVTRIIRDPAPGEAPIVRKEFPGQPGKVYKEHMASKVGQAVGAPVAVTVVDKGYREYSKDFEGNLLNVLGERWEPGDTEGPHEVEVGPFLFMDYYDGTLAGDLPGMSSGNFDPPPRYLGSDQGLMLGLLDTLIGNGDRHTDNWLVTDADTIGGFDHSESFPRYPDSYMNAPGDDFPPPSVDYAGFTHRFFFYRKWLPNDLHPDDIPVLRQRLTALRPEFERFTRSEHEFDGAQAYDAMMRRFEQIAKNAKGAKRKVVT